MGKPTPIDKFSASIDEILTEYAYEVEKGTQEVIDKVGKEAATAVKQNAKQVLDHPHKYPQGWTWKPEHTRTGALGYVNNKTEYRLTHLLEKSHVMRNGTGRSFGPSKARPHIAEVEQMVIDKVEKGIVEVIK